MSRHDLLCHCTAWQSTKVAEALQEGYYWLLQLRLTQYQKTLLWEKEVRVRRHSCCVFLTHTSLSAEEWMGKNLAFYSIKNVELV
jgi:hypothetical protein